MRMTLFIVFVFVALASGCGNKPVRDRQTTDSLVRKPAPMYKEDTAVSNATLTHAEPDSAKAGGDELAGFYKGCIDRYDHPVIIDSVFKVGGDILELHLKHYCLKDSAVKVPKRYVAMYKLDSFVTHNFETQIRLTKNSKLILERTIRKRDFEPYLDTSLRSYAVLLAPEVQFEKNTIWLVYSISIPLTDVGIGASIVLEGDGKIKFEGR